MKNKYQKFVASMGQANIFADEPLSKYVSFRIGGPCDLLYKAKSADDLSKAIFHAREYEIDYFLLGGGTNVLVSDSGFRGLVIKNETSNIKMIGIKGGKLKTGGKDARSHTVFLEVESGVGFNRMVRFSLDQGMSGLEAFLGQPGTVGGAVWINAHNMKEGKFFGDCISSVKLLTGKGKIIEVGKEYFRFGYDKSILQKTGETVLSVIVRLVIGDKKSLWEKAQQVMDQRKNSHPQGVYSSGCVFRNIKKSDAMRIATPDYTCSTGYLLDQAGLKNHKKGNARFSQKHANFIVHDGSAKASDVIELLNLAKKKIKEKYNISLKEEIVLLGDF